MLEYTGGGNATAPNPLSSLVQTAAILRIGTGLLLMTRYGIAAVQDAYHFFFQEQPWDWVPAFHAAGMPYAHLLAPIVAILIVVVALSWIIGFLTRLFAFAFLPVVITTLVVLHHADSPRVEAAWLYLIITVTLLLFGSGTVSVDQLFRLGEGGPKRRR